MLIRLIPVGEVPAQVIEAILSIVPEVVGAKVRLMPVMQLPAVAFNNFRKQYDAEKVLSVLGSNSAAKFIDHSIPSLFVTDADLYYAGLSFVFGLEDPAASAAIISIARLKPEFYDRHPNMTVLIDRAVKEAIHEIGHYLGFEHCQHSWCVMSFSPSVSDVDNKKREFCKDCRIKAAMRGVHIPG
ncbi:MAG: archaemetzincin family Zn-dependent metalloprotease [Candidatus Aenigmatarchaeota archaeon]|nr:archaemetzincin family Zn-dependent metalloprotease [Candidatus Aenigmarchaeota archaeon]